MKFSRNQGLKNPAVSEVLKPICAYPSGFHLGSNYIVVGNKVKVGF